MFAREPEQPNPELTASITSARVLSAGPLTRQLIATTLAELDPRSKPADIARRRPTLGSIVEVIELLPWDWIVEQLGSDDIAGWLTVVDSVVLSYGGMLGTDATEQHLARLCRALFEGDDAVNVGSWLDGNRGQWPSDEFLQMLSVIRRLVQHRKIDEWVRSLPRRLSGAIGQLKSSSDECVRAGAQRMLLRYAHTPPSFALLILQTDRLVCLCLKHPLPALVPASSPALHHFHASYHNVQQRCRELRCLHQN